MKKELISAILGSIIVLTFLYTASDKLLNFNEYVAIMKHQPLPGWSKPILIWLIPFSEILTSVLLFLPKTRLVGFAAATLLMLLFTGYVGLVLLHALKYFPCICGGIFRSITWEKHFVINIILLSIAVAGVIIDKINIHKSKAGGNVKLA